MDNNTFAWVDVSTFNTTNTKAFYAKLFNWHYAVEDDYAFAQCNGKQVAGIYPMPEKFVQINMPSFWMSYIQVQDIEHVVEQAKKHGGKIELQDEAFGGRIALIRDPAGAGFTVYQGAQLPARSAAPHIGEPYWQQLHVSDVKLVQQFYEKVFNWNITPGTNSATTFDVTTANGTPVATIEQLPNTVKGTKQYWMVVFAIQNVPTALTQVTKHGGTVEYTEGNTAIVRDPDGAAFMLQEVNNGASTGSSHTKKWRTVLALLGIYIAVLFNWNWVWGLVFLLWILPDVRSGSTYFVEPITRQESPILFWIIVCSWIGMSVYMLLGAL